MKFGQLVEFKMRNIFLKKPYIKNMVEKLVLDPFIKKKSKLNISLDCQSEMFLLYAQIEVY